MPEVDYDKRGQSLASMGLVERDGDKFNVTVPQKDDKTPLVFIVGRESGGKIFCNCDTFATKSPNDSGFRCEHILAVKHALVAKSVKNDNVPETPAQQISPPQEPPQAEDDDVLEPLPPNAAIQADANKLPHKVKYNENGNVDLFKYQILQNLRVQVPPILLSRKKAGGAAIDFINITDLKDILDIRAGAWTAEIRDYKQIGGQCIMVVRIIIHAKDGDFHSDGNGHEKVDHGAFGDTASNAYAQAFRRAAEGLGLARELWRGKEKIDNKRQQQQQYGQRQTVQRSR
jgi:predicted nucleic acid-binding Zn finger protein